MHSPISHQALYEISLTLGSSRDLEVMLHTVLKAFIQHLGARAGAVFRVTHGKGQSPHVTRAATVSPNNHEEDLQTARAHLRYEGPLPVEVPGMNGQLLLAEIPGFGALCLIEGDVQLSTSALIALSPLLTAMSRACATCDFIQ